VEGADKGEQALGQLGQDEGERHAGQHRRRAPILGRAALRGG
jgi:hypothetical protein